MHKLILLWSEYIDQRNTVRRTSIFLVHISIFLMSGLTAFLLRFEFYVPRAEFRHLFIALAAWVVTKLACFHLAGLNRGWWRFVSIHDIGRLAAANAAAALISGIVITTGVVGFPRSIYVIDLLICFLATAGVRVFVRVAMEAGIQIKRTDQERNVLIYGSGVAGQSLLREIRANSQLTYTVRGFLDDDARKRGLSIQGVRVLGTGSDLTNLADAHRIDEVLVAIPSASGAQMAAILEHCHKAKASCKTIPGLGEMVEGRGLAAQIRDVAVEDLLCRTSARLERDEISIKISGKVVLITGAAGSIGSELCRQISRFGPQAIVALDASETALFHLEREMRQLFPGLALFPVLGSIQNTARLAEVFKQHWPSLVYHAAAYKHVPILEDHVVEAVENNIIGTYNVASAAALYGASDFVMVSSDKAVRPTSVMGATKRFAELLINSLQSDGTKFVSVRFGNVLGSNGSIIPIFKQQIAAGGPVTVTHPDMRRYFMTIPEAAQLVIQASTMGRGGEIFVLDMGQLVKITDLARNLILLSGFRPDEDIKIVFTGIRPGEKLYEELNLEDEHTLPTCHEKIKVFAGKGLSPEDVEESLVNLKACLQSRDVPRLLRILKETISDYNPSVELLDRMQQQHHELDVVMRRFAAAGGMQ
jgi:FlaA1/EpsC-like NDP-sugar epimerase